MSEKVIELEGVWKVFGDKAEQAMKAVKEDHLTKPQVLEKIKGFRAAGYGDEVWTPAPLIERLVAEGKSFRDYDAGK